MNKLRLMVLLLIMLFGGALSFSVSKAEETVIRVPYDYPTIQEAVNMAPYNGIILVLAGTYNENVIIDKPVKLIAAERTAIIDCGGSGNAITISADNVLVDGFTIKNSKRGILIDGASNVTVSNNIIIGNECGIYVITSELEEGNFIIGNIIANNEWSAIYSSNNSIIENSFIGGHVEFVMCGGNRIYHNNFDCRIVEDLIFAGNLNNWTGNFWNTEIYKGIPLPPDNPGYPGYGGDKHPLTAPYKFFPIIWNDEVYPVSFVSNFTLSNIKFMQTEKKISFNVDGKIGTSGFLNVTIPKNFLKGEPWMVMLDDMNVSSQATITENQTHTSIHLYFTDIHNTHKVEIIGTWVTPEFPSNLITSFLLLSIILIIVLQELSGL